MNIIYIKLSDGSAMTHCRTDQVYDSPDDIAESLRAVHYPVLTVSGAAIVCAKTISTLADAGRSLDADFMVSEKQNVPGGDTIIPPCGMVAGDLLATDYCVHYTP